jgi:hypothetical protein
MGPTRYIEHMGSTMEGIGVRVRERRELQTRPLRQNTTQKIAWWPQTNPSS